MLVIGDVSFYHDANGLLAARELATASPRVRSMSVGVEDYCLALGVEPSADGTELLYAVSFVVTICKAVGIDYTTDFEFNGRPIAKVAKGSKPVSELF